MSFSSARIVHIWHASTFRYTIVRMDPKFQSSFIPKNPTAFTATGAVVGRRVEDRGLLSFLALIIFIISILLAIGMVGYKFYLKYRIETMGADLEKALTTIVPEPEIVRELIRFDNRIISTRELIAKHHVLSHLFEFLEISTPKAVRFNDFRYSTTEQGIELSMRGEARGYAALALQADIFSKSEDFKDPIFSDLNLNERGDVDFSFKTRIDPSLLSYSKEIKRSDVPIVTPTSTTSSQTIN